MPNPDPSLTPEEAANMFVATYHADCRPHLRIGFLAGHAHATAILSRHLENQCDATAKWEDECEKLQARLEVCQSYGKAAIAERKAMAKVIMDNLTPGMIGSSNTYHSLTHATGEAAI